MMKKTVNLIAVFIITSQAVALGQTKITGTIFDERGEAIPFATALLERMQDTSLIAFTTTDEKGQFTIETTYTDSCLLSFSCIGYQKKIIPLLHLRDTTFSFEVHLQQESYRLREVVVQGDHAIIEKGDTIVFDAEYFSDGSELVVEEVLRKIPGVDVDQSGVIRIGDQEVEKVMVEGDDFFEKGYRLLTKNMPAKPIDKVEVVKNYQSNALLKKITQSEAVALNLTLEEDAKRQWFGNLTAGYGPSTNSNRYDSKANLMNFGKKNKYYFMVTGNNNGQDVTGDIQHLITPSSSSSHEQIGGQEWIQHPVNTGALVPMIDRDRANRNNDQLISLNAILHPFDNAKIRTTGFLKLHQFSLDRKAVTQFFIGNENFQNTERYHFRDRELSGIFKITGEIDLHKNQNITTQTTISIQQEKALSELNFNGIPQNEDIQSDHKRLDHKNVYTNKLSPTSVLLIKSRFVFHNAPQEYQVDSTRFPEFTQDLRSRIPVRQDIQHHFFYSGAEALLIKRKKENKRITYVLGNQVRQHQFASDFHPFIRENTPPNSSWIINDIQYRTNDFYTGVRYKINHLDWTWNAEIDAHLLNNLLHSAEQDRTQSILLLNTRLTATWEIDKKNTLTGILSTQNTNSDVLEIYDQFLMTSAQSFARGFSDFNQMTTRSLTAKHQYGGWEDRTHLNSIVQFSKQDDVLAPSSIITQNISFRELSLRTDQTSSLFRTSLDQYVPFMAGNVKLRALASTRNFQNITNDITQDIQSFSLQYTGEFRSAWKSALNIHIGSTRSNSSYKVNSGEPQRISSNVSFFDLQAKFKDNTHFLLEFERHNFLNIDHDNNVYHFIDFSVQHKLKNKKVRLMLSGKNLLNTQNFVFNQLSDVQFSQIQYRLIPRYLLGQVEISF